MRYAVLLLGILFAVGMAGCTKQGEAKKPVAPKKVNIDIDTPPAERTSAKPPKVDGPVQTTKTETPTVDTPPPASMPKVVLTGSLQATCVVQVGDTLPPGELPDAEGKPVALASLLGKRATVVLFWNEGVSTESKARAATALDDLMYKVAEPHGAQGVNVIAVNVGDAADVVKAAAAAVKFPVLGDANVSYFAKVAKERLPRVYLLDASGKILWFDMEFSRTTQRELLRGLAAMLSEA